MKKMETNNFSSCVKSKNDLKYYEWWESPLIDMERRRLQLGVEYKRIKPVLENSPTLKYYITKVYPKKKKQ